MMASYYGRADVLKLLLKCGSVFHRAGVVCMCVCVRVYTGVCVCECVDKCLCVYMYASTVYGVCEYVRKRANNPPGVGEFRL